MPEITPDPLAAELAAIEERSERPLAHPGSLPIAHDGVRGLMESAADVPRFIAAVKAVLAKHDEHEGRCGHCREFCTCIEDALPRRCTTAEMHELIYNAWDQCPHGNAPWPCPTVQAVSAALLGEAPGRD